MEDKRAQGHRIEYLHSQQKWLDRGKMGVERMVIRLGFVGWDALHEHGVFYFQRV